MNNIFNFSYQETFLPNIDGSESKFRGVYGEGGNLIAVPKGNRYNLIQTEDVSKLASVFQEKDLKVNPFVFKNGEIIGLNIPMGERASKVGDRELQMRLFIKNNLYGLGYLSVFANRKICTNGMMVTEFSKDKVIKIPHTKDYNLYLQLAQDTVLAFKTLVQSLDDQELKLDATKVDKTQLMYHLNKWFFDYEFPDSQKGKMTFNEFRRYLYEDRNLIKPIDRYDELMNALDREIKYNVELNLNQSMYTVYATVSNYLSRRVEKSGSAAPIEIVQERAFEKLNYFSNVAIEEAVLV